jgi:hypothetical protein
VAHTADGSVALKDGKNPDSRAFLFTRDEWSAFVKGVKNNEFNVE